MINTSLTNILEQETSIIRNTKPRIRRPGRTQRHPNPQLRVAGKIKREAFHERQPIRAPDLRPHAAGGQYFQPEHNKHTCIHIFEDENRYIQIHEY